MFDQNIYERYLDWDVPTIGLNFEELIGQYNLSVAAATLDSKGKEPILGTEGLGDLEAKVLTHQMSYSMPIEEYRKVLQILDSRMLTDDQKTQQLINLMWNNVSTVVKSVQSKLDIIFLGACPTRGYLPLMPIITLKEGYVVLLITRCRPRISLALPLTGPDTNKNNVDPFEDIQGVVDAAQDKVTFDKILMSPARLSYLLKSRKMKQVIFGTDKSGTPLLMSGLNEFLRSNDLPVIETVRRITRIQDNGKLSEYKLGTTRISSLSRQVN